jgi:protein-L-isoaspartate(D-aspartate) O-methyltransferase
MLQPKVEARVLQAAAVKKHEHVLEIGTGSGYMAALLAHKGRHVTTIEIDPAIRSQAQQNLSAYGIANVDVQLGNGAQGWTAGEAEYDVIVISGSLPFLPESLLSQIKVGGRIVAFIGQPPAMSAQVITRTAERVYDTVKLFETVVMPLHAATQPSHFTF